jgi:putative membrane protein
MWAVLASASLVMGVACDDDDSSIDAEEGIVADAGPEGENLNLTDAQIVQVVLVANEGEVMLGQEGLDRATNAAVRDFNTRMVNEHTAARQRLEQLAQAQGLTPEDSPVAQHLQQEVARMIAALERSPDASFDLALMGSQVAAHGRTAMTADSLLAPQARNTALVQELQAQRQTVQQHLQEAATLQNTVFGGAP